jgi:hypothetical protein
MGVAVVVDQLIVSSPPASAAYQSSASEGTNLLRKRLERVANSLSVPPEFRNCIHSMITRIDLEMASPSSQGMTSDLLLFIVRHAQALRRYPSVPEAVSEDLAQVVRIAEGTPLAKQLLTIRCTICQQAHILEHADFFFDRPHRYYYVFPWFTSPTYLESRVRSGGNFMAIDNSEFFIRGNWRVRL